MDNFYVFLMVYLNVSFKFVESCVASFDCDLQNGFGLINVWLREKDNDLFNSMVCSINILVYIYSHK